LDAGVGVMRQLQSDEYAILVLVAMKPVSYLPPIHSAIAEKLQRLGLIRQHDNRWCPTAQGLACARWTFQ
jgi:hypothetical protein